jgi:cyclophilin family peptidyl-prolyl cis-trans isomerase
MGTSVRPAIVASVIFLTLGTLAARADNPVVVLDTTMGKIVVELDEKTAPISVKNFLKYLDDKHYDGTIFHRCVPGFVIQGGGHEPDMKERPTRKAIKNESDNGLKNSRGTIAMAREDEADSATAQFYINVKDNTRLDKANAKDKIGYAVFGRVLEGMDVVDAIVAVPTETRGEDKNVPVKPIVLKSATRK